MIDAFQFDDVNSHSRMLGKVANLYSRITMLVSLCSKLIELLKVLRKTIKRFKKTSNYNFIPKLIT